MESRIARAIQFMMSKGCVSSDEFIEFVESLRGDRTSQITDERVLEAVANINSKLKRYNMMIRYTLDSKTHERFYSLISTVDNDISRKASHHTDKEFDYFRLILDEIHEGPKPYQDLCRLSPHLQEKVQKKLLEEWTNKHWLVRDDDEVRMGPRSLAELDVLFMASRNDTSQPQPSTSG